jgi:UDP-N-acetylglucosamine:LPS N-acetylglucosamine transferase
MKTHNNHKIGLISSRGGHLYQLYLLKDFWGTYPRFWITEKGEDSDFLLKNEKIYYGFFPVTRNIIHAVQNFLYAISVLYKERPTILLSCGAGIAPPVYIAGMLFGCTLIFLDSYTFYLYPSLSARIISLFSTVTLTQHKSIAKTHQKFTYWGKLI